MGKSDNWRARKHLSFTVCILGVVFVSLGVGYSVALYNQGLLTSFISDPTADGRTNTKDRIVQSDTNPFQDHALKARLKSCASALPAIGKLLTRNSEFTVRTQWNQLRPDGHVTQALVGMRYDTPDYKGPAVGILLAAPVNGNCETNAVRVTPFGTSCEKVAEQYLGNSKRGEPLHELPTYSTVDGSQIVLIPSGDKCVSVALAYTESTDMHK